MDEQRRLLDELMGKTRNEDPEKNKGRNFWDDDVDKFFIAGFSPFQEFKNTKSATWLSDCYRAAFPDRPKLRSLEWEQWSRNEELKAQYDALPQHERDKYGYEYDLMLLLEHLVQRCDNRIRAVQEDIKAKNEEMMSSMSQADEQALEAVNTELAPLNAKVKEAEALAEKGADFGQLKNLMQQIENKQNEKLEIMRRVEVWRLENQRSVCDISGNVILPPGATRFQAKHQNIHDHEAGKQYQGWKTARQLLKRLKAQMQDLKPTRSSARRSASRSRVSHGEGATEKDKRRSGRSNRGDLAKDRSRSRSANSSREQHRDRSRDRRRRH